MIYLLVKLMKIFFDSFSFNFDLFISLFFSSV